MASGPKFDTMVRRPETPEQKLDRSLRKIPRPLKHLSIEELRRLVDHLGEEVRAICGKAWRPR